MAPVSRLPRTVMVVGLLALLGFQVPAEAGADPLPVVKTICPQFADAIRAPVGKADQNVVPDVAGESLNCLDGPGLPDAGDPVPDAGSATIELEPCTPANPEPGFIYACGRVIRYNTRTWHLYFTVTECGTGCQEVRSETTDLPPGGGRVLFEIGYRETAFNFCAWVDSSQGVNMAGECI